MKKIYLFGWLFMFAFVFIGCNNDVTHNQQTDTASAIQTTIEEVIDSDIETTSKEGLETTLKDDFDEDIDTVQTSIWHLNWDGFSQCLIDSDIAIDSIKGKIMTYPIIELNDYKTLLISFCEESARNERQEIEKDFDWRFEVSWQHEDEKKRIIGHRLYYYADELSIEQIIRGYATYDPLNDIYAKKITGEILYLCLINEKMYMSINVKTDCKDFESISKQFIDYALEIKKIVNTEGVQ